MTALVAQVPMKIAGEALAVVTPPTSTPPATPKPAALFANYLFTMFPLRKIYAEVNEYNQKALRLTERLGFLDHGRLPDHVWYEDRYWDCVLSSLTREAWLERRERFGFLLAVEEEAEGVLKEGSVVEARVDGATDYEA